MVCAVCLEPLDRRATVLSPCKHAFHHKCSQPWLQHRGSCPLCRAPVPRKLPCVTALLLCLFNACLCAALLNLNLLALTLLCNTLMVYLLLLDASMFIYVLAE